MNPPGHIIRHLAVVALVVGAGMYTFYKRPASKSAPVEARAREMAPAVPAVVTKASTPAELEARLTRGGLRFEERRAAVEALASNGSSEALQRLFTLAAAIRSEDSKKEELAGDALDTLKTCFTMEAVDFLAKDLEQEERFSSRLTEAAAAIGHPKLAEALARRIAGPVDWDTKNRLKLLREMGPYGELLAVAVVELYPLPKDPLQRLPRPALAPSTPLLVEKVTRSAAYRNKLDELARPKPWNGLDPLTPQQFAALSEEQQQQYLTPYRGVAYKPRGRGCSHLMGYPPYLKGMRAKATFVFNLTAYGNRDALPWLQAELAAARQNGRGYPGVKEFEEAIAACDLDPGLLAQPDKKKRWAAIENFSCRGDYRALPVILKELKGYRSPTGNMDLFLAGAINALGNIRDPAAVEALTGLANSRSDYQELQLLADAFGNIGDPACIPGLSAILPNDSASSRAVVALGQIDTAESSKVLHDHFLLEQKRDPRSIEMILCVGQLMKQRNVAARGYLLESVRYIHPSQYSNIARNLRERDPASALSAIAKVISNMPPRARQMLELVRESIEADQQARALGRVSTVARAGA